jgi:formylglycine-generating enzyme required for sulfatase activity
MKKKIIIKILFFVNAFSMMLMAQTGGNISKIEQYPLLSFKADNENFTVSQQSVASGQAVTAGRFTVSYSEQPYNFGRKALVTFKNISHDTIQLHNIVPFGESDKHVYITGKGKHGLSRTHLFRPGYNPVNVIVPDNAWELGFSAIKTSEDSGVCALVRRDRSSIKNGRLSRFETVLYPEGEISYTLWIDNYLGDWQEGLRLMFQERMLYDIEPGTFDNSLLARKDLQWFRNTYITHLMMTWDRRFYDYADGKSYLNEFLEKGKRLYGGTDVLGIWPTWPALGMDERNQWDMFRDLPGGFAGLRRMSDMCRTKGTRFFICYNPWDESTRSAESHFEGMSNIIHEVGVDGVVLDCKGESSKELQEAADRARPGVIMYSEGMAVPRDMQGIPSGRVHNALYYPPMLNLVKFIKPDFAIFRVTELTHERVRREFAVAFFNGYGTELNIFSPGSPEWVDEQYLFLGQTSRILRENTSNFINGCYTPLLPTLNDSIFVNRWDYSEKTVYTVFSLKPEGFDAPLFEIEKTGKHFVDVFNHVELSPVERNGKYYIPVKTAAFDQSNLGTNNEGAVCAIAALPNILQLQLNDDELSFSADAGDKIRIWAGMPSYDKEYKEYCTCDGKNTIRLLETFPHFEGKFIVQVFNSGELLDERIVYIKPGTARRVSRTEQTPTVAKAPKGMVEIPAGIFVCNSYRFGDSFIPYPAPPTQPKEKVQMPRYFMDKYPVTNAEFKVFMDATAYQPADTANFLKHWNKGQIPKGMENFPVVYVAYEDAQAYAKWAGKRLPTEIEWQYAAQTSAGNEWPWKQKIPVRRVEEPVTNTLSVWKLEGIEEGRCNTGDGKLYAVGSYPKGANPYGLHDLVGCVWQLTNDLYDNATYRYVMMKGGSYFRPSSSWWYVQGGPRELNYRQYLLRVSPGFERNATVGFRCVKDADFLSQ